MEGSSKTNRETAVEAKASNRRRTEELYRMAARYARARAVARRVPGLEEECEKLEAAFARALYNSVVGGYK